MKCVNDVKVRLPLSFSRGGNFEKGTGLSSFGFFNLGMPIAVSSAPLGLPLFLTLGGSLIIDNVAISGIGTVLSASPS